MAVSDHLSRRNKFILWGCMSLLFLLLLPLLFIIINYYSYCYNHYYYYYLFNLFYNLFSTDKKEDWIQLFLAIGRKVIGYEKAFITPYLHILVYHLPRFLNGEIPFKAFTGQGVEKVNNVVRAIHHNKSNKHDPCKEAMLSPKNCPPAKFWKRTKESTIIKKKKKKRIPVIRHFEKKRKWPPTSNWWQLVLIICVREMRDKLKEMKVITKVRRVDRDFKGCHNS